jgi:hypothetical protein
MVAIKKSMGITGRVIAHFPTIFLAQSYTTQDNIAFNFPCYVAANYTNYCWALQSEAAQQISWEKELIEYGLTKKYCR